MPRLTKEIKEGIKNLEKSELQEIVTKLAAKDKSILNFIQINYIDKDFAEKDLFEDTKKDLNRLMMKGHRGYTDQLRLANMLTACIRRINEFTKISKNKMLEAELLIILLREPFCEYGVSLLGTCFTKYDNKVAIILQRLVNVVTKHLHEDIAYEYKSEINEYLSTLHRKINYLESVYRLPQEI